jgi:integrase/recombinase XerD
MRVGRAVDDFLAWRQVERDATPRSVASYWQILRKLVDAFPEAQLADLTTDDLRGFLLAWRERSAATRSNVISVVHSFFAWAEAEDLVEVDPSRKIRRPPKRRPAIHRPSLSDLAKLRNAATLHERPALLLMEGAGLRNTEVRMCRWQNVDLVNGRVHVFRKGGQWQWVPLAPDVLGELRQCFRGIRPELDDYVFTVEVEQWISSTDRQRRRKDPKQPRSSQALGRMVKRVCRRAGISEYSPHPLRHGFGNRFLRESDKDLARLQALYGHSRSDTTQGYTDELSLDEQAEALRRAVERRYAQASPDPATLGNQPSSSLEIEEWTSREFFQTLLKVLRVFSTALLQNLTSGDSRQAQVTCACHRWGMSLGEAGSAVPPRSRLSSAARPARP